MKRPKIVAGNWKMNPVWPEAEKLANEIRENWPPIEKIEVIVAPPFPYLMALKEIWRETPVQLAAQNAHWEDTGAFTGEVSPLILKSIGIGTVILGHSERRLYFCETEEILQKKVNKALSEELRVIYCVGEKLEERQNERHFEVVKNQLVQVLNQLHKTAWKNLIIAYEPVWAIGTGQTATPAQAQEMHAFIREVISGLAGNSVAESIPVLYGGSVKPGNAREIFSQPDVDGGLVGGASLKATDFLEIIQQAQNLAK